MTQDAVSPRVRASLILPVYNHEERLAEVLDDIRSTLADGEYEIIVVYDVTNSEMIDSVKVEQEQLQKVYGIRPVTRVNQRGFGSALRCGFEVSHGEIVIPIMADCSDDIAAIPRMLDEIGTGADIVAGSRYMPGGRIVGDTPKQQLSRLYSLFMRFISGVSCHDVSNSFKAYRRAVWENIANESNSFDISVEMTIKAAMQGYRISQVPSVWINRQAGTSQFAMLKEFRNYMRWLFYATSRAPSRFFLLLAALSIFSLIIYGTRLLHPIFRDNAG